MGSLLQGSTAAQTESCVRPAGSRVSSLRRADVESWEAIPRVSLTS